MSTQETAGATTLGGNYMHTGNSSATDMFNRRTVEQDASFVAQHLRPGMRLVDFGCGAGSLTCGFARLVAPGDVLGIDISAQAIRTARALAAQATLSNTCFSVGNINHLDLPPESFDVAHFSGVLMHLSEPELALQSAFRSLKSGGIVAAREANGAGNWAAGPNAESVLLVGSAVREENKGKGSDFLIGGRLPALVREAGFHRVASRPSYSAALSDVKSFSTMLRSGWSGTIRPMLIQRGISSGRCDQLLDEIAIWAESEDSLYAAAECAVVGWKP